MDQQNALFFKVYSDCQWVSRPLDYLQTRALVGGSIVTLPFPVGVRDSLETYSRGFKHHYPSCG